MELDQNFWEERYQNKQTGWDLGHISPPIKDYIDQLKDKNIKILIPGCGHAYEAEYLHRQGFTNVFLIDLAQSAFDNFKKRVSDFPETHLVLGNFFDHTGSYDLIIEQTFFCAIDPALRKEYVNKVKEVLKPNGKLVGLLFNIPLNTEHPPFGGNREEYLGYFKPYFSIKTLEEAHNSIAPRSGNELFIIVLNDK